jgi:hypothetical protein
MQALEAEILRAQTTCMLEKWILCHRFGLQQRVGLPEALQNQEIMLDFQPYVLIMNIVTKNGTFIEKT